MRLLALLVFAIAIIGCAEQPEPMAEPPAGEQTSAPGSGGDGIGVISPAAGGVSPVTGAESVAGGSSGGSGVGQAAKNQAKDAAAKAGGSTLDDYNLGNN